MYIQYLKHSLLYLKNPGISLYWLSTGPTIHKVCVLYIRMMYMYMLYICTLFFNYIILRKTSRICTLCSCEGGKSCTVTTYVNGLSVTYGSPRKHIWAFTVRHTKCTCVHVLYKLMRPALRSRLP